MRKPSDKQVEGWIGQVLRFGVLFSSAVTIVGLSIYLFHHAGVRPNYHSFNPAYGTIHHWSRLLPDAFHGNSIAIIQLGILLLIATPVARVAFLVGAFALERDRMYVAVSGLVLLVLIYSIFFATS